MAKEPVKKLEERTLEELKKIAVSYGVTDVTGFNNKSSLISTIRALKDLKKAAQDAFSANMVVQPVVTPVSVPKNENDNDRWMNKAMRMKASLDQQPKVSFLIPLGFKEKKGTIETVILNGYRFEIKKGVMVQIPKQVAEVLAESYELEMDAGEQFRTDREKTLDDGRTVNVKEVLG